MTNRISLSIMYIHFRHIISYRVSSLYELYHNHMKNKIDTLKSHIHTLQVFYLSYVPSSCWTMLVSTLARPSGCTPPSCPTPTREHCGQSEQSCCSHCFGIFILHAHIYFLNSWQCFITLHPTYIRSMVRWCPTD